MVKKLTVWMMILLVGGQLTMGCGPSSNINALLFVEGEDKNKRFDALMVQAQNAYDHGEFKDALKYAEGAYAISPESEQAAQLLAFTYLAQVGIDVFSLIEKMSTLGKATEGSEGSLDILGQLADILALTPDDMEALGELSSSSSSFFTSLPVYLPHTPGELAEATSPRALVATLAFANKAIAVMCPFVATSLLEASRQRRYQCTATRGEVKTPAQSYLVFALAHIVETLVFNSVLLYGGDEEGNASALFLAPTQSTQDNSNLFKRAMQLNSQQISLAQMGAYAEAVVELKQTMDQVFDASEGSMLSETLLDLKMVVDSMAKIAGIPADVTVKLENALAAIKNTAAKAGGASSQQEGQTPALRQELNQKIVKEMNTNIDKYLGKFANTDLSAEQQKNAATMCAAADSLGEGSGVSTPARCDAYL